MEHTHKWILDANYIGDIFIRCSECDAVIEEDELKDELKLVLARNWGCAVALDALLEDGFSVNIRKTKHGFSAECHDWSADEHRSFYGKGSDWMEAVVDAANRWAYPSGIVKE